MDLTGHRSNPPQPLGALLEGRSDRGVDAVGRGCDAEQERLPIGSRHPRHDWALDAYRAPRVLAQPAPRPDVIEVSDLVRRFGEFAAVDGISFEVPEGT